MSRDLDELIPEFKQKVQTLLQQCDDTGHTMRPFFTRHTPFEQAAG